MVKRTTFVSLAIAATALCGCSLLPSSPPPFVPVEASIPIATPIYCNVAPIAHPPLAIASLVPASSPGETVRAYAMSVAELKAALRERDEIIAGCAAPAADGEVSK